MFGQECFKLGLFEQDDDLVDNDQNNCNNFFSPVGSPVSSGLQNLTIQRQGNFEDLELLNLNQNIYEFHQQLGIPILGVFDPAINLSPTLLGPGPQRMMGQRVQSFNLHEQFMNKNQMKNNNDICMDYMKAHCQNNNTNQQNESIRNSESEQCFNFDQNMIEDCIEADYNNLHRINNEQQVNKRAYKSKKSGNTKFVKPGLDLQQGVVRNKQIGKYKRVPKLKLKNLKKLAKNQGQSDEDYIPEVQQVKLDEADQETVVNRLPHYNQRQAINPESHSNSMQDSLSNLDTYQDESYLMFFNEKFRDSCQTYDQSNQQFSNTSNTNSQSCEIELYSKYKQIKQRKIFYDDEQRFLDSLTNDQKNSITDILFQDHQNLMEKQKIKKEAVENQDFEENQLSRNFYNQVESTIADRNVELIDFPQDLMIPSQLPKLSRVNNQLYDRIVELQTQVDRLHSHWRALRLAESQKKKLRQQRIQSGEVNKRKRRAAKRIQRRYKCPVESCNKSYGSDGSLNQHILSKHPREFQDYRSQKFQSVIVGAGFSNTCDFDNDQY
eukprot:403364925